MNKRFHRDFGRLQALRFRRFVRRAYAVFLSLHREVSIGRLRGCLGDCQLLKSGQGKAFAVLYFFMSLFLLPVMAGQDDENPEIALEEAVVAAQRIDIASSSQYFIQILKAGDIAPLPVDGLGDVLQLLPGLDVRTRGGYGMQADLSMRGGSFDQVAVLVNGINLTDAQTGHFNLDLPLDLSMVERIEVLHGPVTGLAGQTSFCGAVNIVTGRQRGNRLQAGVQAGQYGLRSARVGIGRELGAWQGTLSLSALNTAGYMPNTDLRKQDAFMQLQRSWGDHGSVNFQAGLQNKGFGAYGFYSLRYPDQYEENQTFFVSAGLKQGLKNLLFEADTWLRLHNDRFELFRQGRVEPPSWYTTHNYHLTASSGLKVALSCFEDWGKSQAGFSLTNDRIVSNVLGEPLSRPLRAPFAPDSILLDHGRRRVQAGGFLEQHLVAGRWSGCLGLTAGWHSMFGRYFGYAASLVWQAHGQGSLRLHLGRGLRMPTFTDLYYQSATQVANPDLQPEISHQLSLGYEGARGPWQWNLELYGRQGSRIIDWIRLPEETRWHSVNHTRIRALGGESRLSYAPEGFLQRASVAYAFCTLDKEAGDYLSLYALDYLRHKLAGRLSFRLCKELGCETLLQYRQRAGQYTDLAGNVLRYEPVWLLNTRLHWTQGHCRFSLEADNLLDRRYCDYGGVLQPGRWFKAGLEVSY
ncbi:MAG: TonB-dependent receptor [Bacteroidales bacterium]|nr:TonB-dependent receptor [Bacteroidales bacterium]